MISADQMVQETLEELKRGENLPRVYVFSELDIRDATKVGESLRGAMKDKRYEIKGLIKRTQEGVIKYGVTFRRAA